MGMDATWCRCALMWAGMCDEQYDGVVGGSLRCVGAEIMLFVRCKTYGTAKFCALDCLRLFLSGVQQFLGMLLLLILVH